GGGFWPPTRGPGSRQTPRGAPPGPPADREEPAARAASVAVEPRGRVLVQRLAARGLALARDKQRKRYTRSYEEASDLKSHFTQTTSAASTASLARRPQLPGARHLRAD